MATKYRIAEQCRNIITGLKSPDDSKVSYQELMVFVNQAFAYAVKMSLFANKKEGETDINGTFIYPFDNVAIALDSDKNMYYAELPAAYIDLPVDMGFQHISWQQSQDDPFVLLRNGHLGLFKGLQAETMQGRNTAFVENNKIYLPKVTSDYADKTLLIKLAVALDGIAEDEQIAIPPDIEYQIIQMAVQMYSVEQQRQLDQTETKFKG